MENNLNQKEKWILIRGLGRGRGHWGDFPERLKYFGHEVELVDIPGNGVLNHLYTPLKPNQVVESLRSQVGLDAEGKYQKLNLCGVSLGGMMALKWAELHPDEVNKVVVVNTSLLQCSKIQHRLQLKQWYNFLKLSFSTGSESEEQIVLAMTSNNEDRKKKLLPFFINYGKKHGTRKINYFRQLVLAMNVRIHFPLKSKIHIIYSLGDNLVNSQCSLDLKNKILSCSDSSLLEITEHEWGGHDLPLDDPEWLIKNLN